jgi:deoxyribose-phosphate aldolase
LRVESVLPMQILPTEILLSIDLSAVRANQTDIDIADLIATAREYGCGLVTVLPAQTALARQLLGSAPLPKLGGNVGFPSGGQTPAVKAIEARELVDLGCDELDMVVNLSAILSGRMQDVCADIAGVVAAAQGKPLKVILECAYLNEEQMRSGCEAAVEAGAAFVKTSTGWIPGGATPEMVAFLTSCVGKRIGVKASGGIRTLEQLIALYRCGARRFGIGLRSGLPILQALATLNEEKIPIDL